MPDLSVPLTNPPITYLFSFTVYSAVGVSKSLSLLPIRPITDVPNSVRNTYLRCGHTESLVSLLPLLSCIVPERFPCSPRLRYG
jgi:hypothetical protein